MKSLLYKEFKLSLHPTAIIFLFLSAMMLIPNYPYLVIFFYTSLAIFFICLNGRENHDIFYTMSLPVAKKDIVKSRFGMCIILQLVQVLIAVPFVILRNKYPIPNETNSAGLDANIALFGFAFIMLGIFNLVFFTKFYKDPNKVGKAFVLSVVATMLFMFIIEASVHICPFMKYRIDTKDPTNLTYKLIILFFGIIFFVAATIISYNKSSKSFEVFDL